jgi:hypothetical protein
MLKKLAQEVAGAGGTSAIAREAAFRRGGAVFLLGKVGGNGD